MKRILLAAAMIAVSGAMTEASAQISKKFKGAEDSGDKNQHYPHRGVRPGRQMPVHVSYDSSTTILTISFSQRTDGGTVEVYRDGVKVTGITAGGGTTFSCMLNDYGEGDYDIIVSRGNTVVYSRNVSVR